MRHGRARARCGQTGRSLRRLEASPRLLDYAKLHHGPCGRFIVGDAASLRSSGELTAGSFDRVVFLLSIQDMEPLDEIPAYPGIERTGPRARAENRANREIPLFMGLRAVKVGPAPNKSHPPPAQPMRGIDPADEG